jgi:CMP-N,N'-diacetyllegionaminic acid synthase
MSILLGGKVAMSVVCVIPARGGSKGVPQKNIRQLNNLPLIVHSILDAQQAMGVDHVYVSTDSPQIASVASEAAAEVILRPDDLATDTASSESALIHALDVIESQGIEVDLVVFLQCTSPIRTAQDIDAAIAQLQAEDADSLLSVSPSHRFLWHQVDDVAKSINYDYRHRKRRQDMAPQFMENGSLYVFKPWVLKQYENRLGGKVTMFTMSDAASWEIDSLLDFEIAEFLMKK